MRCKSAGSTVVSGDDKAEKYTIYGAQGAKNDFLGTFIQFAQFALEALREVTLLGFLWYTNRQRTVTEECCNS